MDGPPRPAPAPEVGSTSFWRQAMLIAALALTLNLAGNGRVSLFDRDEPRYAGCTREMRSRGDWLFPTFNDEPRYHKPVLIYWLMRVGFAIGGDNPFGARLASAVAGTCTCVIVLAMGRRMFGPRAGLIASLVLATAPIMVIESKLATTDATLTLWLVGCQFCLWELSRRDSRRLAAAFWALLGLAFLTKGPVGPALLAAAGLVSWRLGGPTVVWSRLHARWGVPLFLLVAAPWYVIVGVLSRGEFFSFAIGNQVAQRVVTPMEQHGGVPGYYIGTTMLMFHPWSALLPAAIIFGWKRRRRNDELGFLLGWIIGPLILLECVQTKLLHYYLPAYPACALLIGWLVAGVVGEAAERTEWRMGAIGLYLLRGFGFGLAWTAVAGAVFLPGGLKAPCAALAIVIAVGTFLGSQGFRLGMTERAVARLATAWGLVLFLVGAWMLPSAEPYRLSRIVGERLAHISDEKEAPPVLLSFQEPTLIYTMGRSAPMIRKWDQFYAQLDRHGAVVTAIAPFEVPEFALRDDHLEVDYLETIEGFNFTKGETQTLRLATIRRRSVAKAKSDPAVRRMSGE